MCGLFASTTDIVLNQDFAEIFSTLGHRGPDDKEVEHINDVVFAFHRLAIMDPTHRGDQPFHDQEANLHLMCNGEVYNYETLFEIYKESYPFKSKSDCEVILPMFRQYGIEETAKRLDAEFALVIYDSEKEEIFAARDPIGIRPLFYGYARENGKIMFASEAKVLHPFCQEIQAFPPGHYYDGEGNFVEYCDIAKVEKFSTDSMDIILKSIREKLIEGVRKRLVADVPVGFLLSGGLDSSLVCGIAAKLLNKKITTFSVGLNDLPIDIKYAKEVADFIKSDHHEVYFSREDTINYLPEVIKHLETWDITTVRASIGMYLVCKYIHEKTPIKVILTGEISDELFGYKYTDFAPNADEFQKEAQKRVKELYMYDVLRADRCISAHALEARVPFGDLDFVKYVMSIPAETKMNSTGVGKYLLRKAFEGEGYIPDAILWRDKAAFSDAVGHGMVDTLKDEAEKLIKSLDSQYEHGKPFTKESLWYRNIFESFYPGRGELIKDFWMPNKSWENCNVDDPSARVLPNYGSSGN